MSTASLLLIELLVLGVKLLYTALESLFRTFLPPVEKSLLNEIILVSCFLITNCNLCSIISYIENNNVLSNYICIVPVCVQMAVNNYILFLDYTFLLVVKLLQT